MTQSVGLITPVRVANTHDLAAQPSVPAPPGLWAFVEADGSYWTWYPTGTTPPGGTTTTAGLGGTWSLTVNSSGGGAGTTTVKLEHEVKLADLQALGAVASGTINIGTPLPANARVVPSMCEIQIVTPLGAAGGHTLTGAVAVVRGQGYPPAGVAVTAGNSPANLLDPHSQVYYGGNYGSTSNSGSDVGGLSPTQGGQQLYVYIALTGTTTFDLLPQGDFIVRVFYQVIA